MFSKGISFIFSFFLSFATFYCQSTKPIVIVKSNSAKSPPRIALTNNFPYGPPLPVSATYASLIIAINKMLHIFTLPSRCINGHQRNVTET